MELTDEFSDWLDTITSFNINARYDDYKKEFYNLCTREYTELWIERRLLQYLIQCHFEA